MSFYHILGKIYIENYCKFPHRVTRRHTFASWLVQKGVPLYNVSQLMGHSDLQMTKRYAHLAPENQKAAIMVLEGVVGGKRSENDLSSLCSNEKNDL